MSLPLTGALIRSRRWRREPRSYRSGCGRVAWCVPAMTACGECVCPPKMWMEERGHRRREYLHGSGELARGRRRFVIAREDDRPLMCHRDGILLIEAIQR